LQSPTKIIINQGTSYRPISLISRIAEIEESSATMYNTTHTPQVKHQHGFKTHHYTTTALHQPIDQITEGFNKEEPHRRTVVVSLNLSKAFDTVNIHSLIHKLHQTTVPNTIVKFISNYIKGQKG